MVETKTQQSVRERTEVHSTQVSKAIPADFKPYDAPRRRSGLAENQASVSKHSINLPLASANQLGPQVAVLWSDSTKSIALQKSANGGYKLKQLGKNKSTKYVYARSFIEAKKIKHGRYTTQFDDKTQMLIVSVEVTKS